jgi:hypothetical protein
MQGERDLSAVVHFVAIPGTNPISFIGSRGTGSRRENTIGLATRSRRERKRDSRKWMGVIAVAGESRHNENR